MVLHGLLGATCTECCLVPGSMRRPEPASQAAERSSAAAAAPTERARMPAPKPPLPAAAAAAKRARAVPQAAPPATAAGTPGPAPASATTTKAAVPSDSAASKASSSAHVERLKVRGRVQDRRSRLPLAPAARICGAHERRGGEGGGIVASACRGSIDALSLLPAMHAVCVCLPPPRPAPPVGGDT